MILKTNDGVNLVYSDEGKGLPVIFIPGYTVFWQSWSKQMEAFLNKGYRVISLDRRSHGASDAPSYGQRMARHGKDLYDLIMTLDLHSVILIGNSMGASVILSYISLFGDERVSGIVDIDQTPKMINDEDWKHGMYGLTRDNFPTFFDTPLPDTIYKQVEPKFMAEMLGIMESNPKFDLNATKPLLLDHAFANWLDVLPLINVPILFIAGKNSPVWPSEHAEASASLCKKGQWAVVDDCGHIVHWEQPELCNELLLDFAKSI